MGRGNTQPVGGPRGEVTGWSRSSVRRHKRWLYSVEAGNLDGVGTAVTLTMRDTPASHVEWTALLRRLFRFLRDDAGMIRWHWVVEWQRRGAPHVHLAIYAPAGTAAAVGARVMDAWVALASDYSPRLSAQHQTPITGAVGWLKYLSKHASRGVAHYQRQGMPAGWEKTGRLWGYGGSWPIAEPVAGVLTDAEFWRIRRMVRRYAIAQARREALRYEALGKHRKAASCWDSVTWTRGMLRCHDRNLSTVRGVSDWVPGDVFLELAVCAGWSGTLSEVSETL